MVASREGAPTVQNRGVRYFHHLNYTLGNEDTSVELAVEPDRPKHVLCVAGSGSRVLPLLSRNPERVTCVDVSPEQLRLTELRVEAARALTHDAYLGFWGYPPKPAGAKERRRLFDRIALPDPSRAFWLDVFDHNEWASILYEGRWERTFGKLATVNQALTREAGRRLFDARTDAEHAAYLREGFPRNRWLLTLFVLGNPLVFNLLLYKGDFPRKNIAGTPFAFYREAFDKLLDLGAARDNFFLQVVFFGALHYARGNPIECHPDVYARLREGAARARIDYVQGDIVDQASRLDQPVDFVSLSDVASYLHPPREQTFMHELAKVMSPGARMVARYYLRVPERVDREGLRDVTDRYADVIAREKVGVYRIEVVERS